MAQRRSLASAHQRQRSVKMAAGGDNVVSASGIESVAASKKRRRRK
jgi:hypothetical protein